MRRDLQIGRCDECATLYFFIYFFTVTFVTFVTVVTVVTLCDVTFVTSCRFESRPVLCRALRSCLGRPLLREVVAEFCGLGGDSFDEERQRRVLLRQPVVVQPSNAGVCRSDHGRPGVGVQPVQRRRERDMNHEAFTLHGSSFAFCSRQILTAVRDLA